MAIGVHPSGSILSASMIRLCADTGIVTVLSLLSRKHRLGNRGIVRSAVR